MAMILVLFRNELKMILRDRRSVLLSIVLPLVVMPLMLFSSTWMQKKREAKLRSTTYHYAVTGPEAASARSLLAATKALISIDAGTNASKALALTEDRLETPFQALTNGDIHFVVEGLSKGQAISGATVAEPSRKDGPPWTLRISFRADRDDASAGVNALEQALRKSREAGQVELLASRGLPLRFGDLAQVTVQNVSSKGHVAGLKLGRMLTLMLLFFMMMAGTMVASDLIAGEKERGTLETLLTSAATRVEIVSAKQLVIVFVALTITIIQAANLLLYVGLRVIPVPVDFATAAPPGVALLILLLFLPVTGVLASVLLLTSGYARTYKEAQLYFTPVFLLGLSPALVPLLPGLQLRSAIVLIPVANIAVAVKEVLIGVFDWPMLVVAWLVTAGTAIWLMRLTVRTLSSERLITSSERDVVDARGGFPLFERHVWIWFAVLWALLLILGNYLEKLDIRAQVFLNIAVLFFGASLLMIWKYRLNPREAFALRLPKLGVWPVVLMAAPCGVLAGTGLFRLVDQIVPVPPEIVEGFSKAVAPEQVPFWQIVLFLAILPGVMEELTFRGALLHGLHRRLRPIPLALTVGLIFGLFHAALFRLAPTAFLGVLLAAITLLTGSIFPAMLWHATSNGLALAAGLRGYPVQDLPWPWFAFGAAGLALAFWILWRNRTPYPGLRTVRRRPNGNE
jgi:sodium transport system permease protein